MMNIWLEGEHIYKYFKKKYTYILKFFLWDKHGIFMQNMGNDPTSQLYIAKFSGTSMDI